MTPKHEPEGVMPNWFRRLINSKSETLKQVQGDGREGKSTVMPDWFRYPINHKNETLKQVQGDGDKYAVPSITIETETRHAELVSASHQQLQWDPETSSG